MIGCGVAKSPEVHQVAGTPSRPPRLIGEGKGEGKSIGDYLALLQGAKLLSSLERAKNIDRFGRLERCTVHSVHS